MLDAFDALIRQVERLSRWLAGLGGVVLLAMVFLISSEILMRRTIGYSFGLSFEYSGYALAISASWSFAYALFHKAHIRIDAAYVHFSQRGRLWLDLLALASFAAFAVMAAQAALSVFQETLMRESVSNTPLHTPMWIPQMLWIVGWLWFAFATLLLLARVIFAAVMGDGETVQRLAGSSTLDEQIEEEAPIIEELGI